MIAYCAADPIYFNLYFDLWATQMNRFYPDMKKIVAVYNPSKTIEHQCQVHGVELRVAQLVKNPVRAHYYLMRWLNLPVDTEDLILETQINCLPVRTQIFDKNQTADHLRIARPKRNTSGGVSAAVFKLSAAKRIVAQAEKMLNDPYDGDHPMNQWQAQNLIWEKSVTEQQFKSLDREIEPWCCWITAGTSQHYTAQQKLQILHHYSQQKI